MTRALPLLLLLTGCAAFGVYTCPLSGTSVPPASEQSLRDAWAAKFGALPARCPHWAWSVVTSEEQDRVCLASENAACTIFPAGCPLTLTTQPYAADVTLAAHEFSHAALFCLYGNGDAGHTNALVWAPDGFVHTFHK